MAKPEWGVKRICLSCSARFYDLMRSPIVCPSCGVTFDVEAATRAKRSRPAGRPLPDDTADSPVREVASESDEAEDAVEVEEAVDDAEIEGDKVADDDDDDSLIEDTADLGEDEDMSDVIADDRDEEGERH